MLFVCIFGFYEKSWYEIQCRKGSYVLIDIILLIQNGTNQYGRIGRSFEFGVQYKRRDLTKIKMTV